MFTSEGAASARARGRARRVVGLVCLAAVAAGCGVGALDASGRAVAAPDRKETNPAGETTGPAEPPASAVEADRHPLALLGDEELERRLLHDRPSLGPVSLGQPDAGLLWNGVKMPEGERWTLVDPERAWATPETVQFVIAAIDKVHEQFPGTRKLFVGDLSRKEGGRFGAHISHRSGREVDLGFYYKKRGAGWYTEATEESLDVPRTWALIRALVTETDLELILVDRSTHWPLRSYARSIGEDAAWVRSLFVKSPPPEARLLIQHDDRHKRHLHVRFYNPIAQQTGYRIYPLAVKNELFKARQYHVSGWAKRGDTFEGFLERHGMTPTSFRSANGVRRFRPGSSFKILRYGPVDPGEGPVVVPPRRLPP